jgi:hypothetical protein
MVDFSLETGASSFPAARAATIAAVARLVATTMIETTMNTRLEILTASSLVAPQFEFFQD